MQPENTVFAFMDYTNGTGRQLYDKCVPKINTLLDLYPKWKKSIFIFMYVVQADIFDRETANQKFNVDVGNWDTIYDEKMLSYKDKNIIDILSEQEILSQEYDDFVNKYCHRSGSQFVGYRNYAFLTCHHYSCPNNTLTFFWKSSERWNNLFQGSQTRGGVPYR